MQSQMSFSMRGMFDFLSYGYAQHVNDGVKAQYEAVGI